MDLEGTEIEIAISNAGTGTTRSARPVGSSEAHNNVDHVQLVFFQNNEVVKGVEYVAKTVTGSYSVDQNGLIKFDKIGDPNTPGNEPHENQKATLQVKGLDAGSYTIVAYGWNGESFPYGTISGPETGKMYYKADNTTSQKTGFNVEEVFAGTTEAIAKANTTETEDEIKTIVKFENSVKVVLTRQVAGMLAYFENVPKMIGETQVRKVTVDLIGQSTGFYFPASLWGKEAEQSEEFNGIGTTTTSTTELLTFSIYNPQIQFSTKSETKRPQIKLSYKTKRSENRKRTTPKMQPEKVAFLVSTNRLKQALNSRPIKTVLSIGIQ